MPDTRSPLKISQELNGFALRESTLTLPPVRYIGEVSLIGQPFLKDFGSRTAPLSGKIARGVVVQVGTAEKNTSQIPKDKADAALALALDASRRMDAAVSEMRSALSELRSDFNALRAELKEEFKALRVEVKGDIQSLRTEMREEIQSLRMSVDNRFNQLQGHITIWFMVLTSVIALLALFSSPR
uniref:DUF1640 domain-containing protein n=1 Tax=Thermus caliditerrae TaxID=1330700 RepID=A0A7C5VJ90_9DEIN